MRNHERAKCVMPHPIFYINSIKKLTYEKLILEIQDNIHRIEALINDPTLDSYIFIQSFKDKGLSGLLNLYEDLPSPKTTKFLYYLPEDFTSYYKNPNLSIRNMTYPITQDMNSTRKRTSFIKSQLFLPRLIKKLQSHSSSDGKLLASGTEDKPIIIWS
jgi:hypothetical protein